MPPLAGLARTDQPGRDGPRIQAKGGDEGLEGTAVAQQGEDDGHQVRSRVHPVAGRALGRGEGLPTGTTAITLLRLAMHAHVSLSPLPSGRTLGVVAKWALRVHRWPPLDAIVPAQANHVQKDARRACVFSSPQTVHHG
jgi:hypothetical protein